VGFARGLDYDEAVNYYVLMRKSGQPGTFKKSTEGTTKVKKWWLVGITLLIALSGVLVGGSCGENKPEEGAGVIKVPGGPEINVIFGGPPELKVTWEKLGMEGLQLHLVGTLENVSDQKISFEEIAFSLDGIYVGRWPSSGNWTLEPAGEAKFEQGIADYSERSRIIEVRIRGFNKIRESVTMPTESPVEPKGGIFTGAPETLEIPEEVVAAYAFFCDKGDYSGAEKLCTEHFVGSYGEPKRYWGKISNGASLSRVVITRVVVKDIAGGEHRAKIRGIFYFRDGSSYIAELGLVKEDGKWKLYD